MSLKRKLLTTVRFSLLQWIARCDFAGLSGWIFNLWTASSFVEAGVILVAVFIASLQY
jgi:hypothetical protein